ncbi:MAG: hypothetical protein ABIT10_00330 [Alteraurantiacibacter sp.]
MAYLPQNTEVLLSLNQELTTRGDWMTEGRTFDLTVVNDVLLGEFVVVPQGSRASGTVTWMTNKGMFGKSGKFEIEINYIDVSGRRIPVNGHFRQEGEGSTVATVGAVILLWPAAFAITGRSGRMPAGMELTVVTEDRIPVRLPDGATVQPIAIAASAPAEVQPITAQPTVTSAVAVPDAATVAAQSSSAN